MSLAGRLRVVIHRTLRRASLQAALTGLESLHEDEPAGDFGREIATNHIYQIGDDGEAIYFTAGGLLPRGYW